MSGILQSYEVVNPIPKTQPFIHYKGKADYHGFSIQPDKLLRLSYIDVDKNLINSQSENLILSMIGYERKFISINDISQVPISVSISKTPKNPLTWEVTYLFPIGNPYDYINNVFQSSQEDFKYDSIGILSWNINCNLDYSPFGGDGIFEGYSTREITFNINATCDFDITDFNKTEGILLEGLNLNPNINNLQSSRRVSEDTSLEPVYQFSWSFGVL